MIRKAWHSNMRSWSECRGAILTKGCAVERPGASCLQEPRQMARIGCLAERNRSASIESLERSYDVDRTEEPKSPQALNFSHHRTVWKMAFVPMRLKPE